MLNNEKKTVNLSTEILFRECSKNPYLALDNYYNVQFMNRENNIHEIFGYRKFNDDFASSLTCYNTDNSLVGMIRFNYDEYLTKLLQILNVSLEYLELDDDKLDCILLDRINILSSVKNEIDLYEKFPILYNDLINGRKYFSSLSNLERNNNDDNLLYGPKDYYYKCGLQLRCDRFITQQVRMYTRYVTDRKKLKDKYETGPSLNNYLMDVIDKDKLYMYVMYLYLEKCDNTNDMNEIRYYMNLINKYLKSDINKYVSIVVDGKKVDWTSIEVGLICLRKRLRDESNILDWELLPPGRIPNKVSDNSNGKIRESLFNIERIERLRKLGKEKENLYENSGYYAKAIGLRRYNGYLAYFYENGEVLLDTEYRDDVPTTAVGNSIYNLKVQDFNELSKLDKTTLKNNPSVNRIIHRGNWIDKVNEIINREVTEESLNATHSLVKKIKHK